MGKNLRFLGLGLLILAALSTGCAKVKDKDGDVKPAEPTYDPILDALPKGAATDQGSQLSEVLSTFPNMVIESRVSDEERAALVQALYGLTIFDASGAISSSDPFNRFFGGSSLRMVIPYLRERAKLFISYRGKPEDLNMSGGKGVLVAKNSGFAAFLYQTLLPEYKDEFLKESQLNTPELPHDYSDPHVGLIELGAFPKFSLITRLETVIHEARHSDCTGGIPTAEFAVLRAGFLKDIQNQGGHAGSDALVAMKTRACGHMHIPCPDGHPLKGLLACDAEAWGSYSAGAIYSRHLKSFCKNCNDAQIEKARMSYVDSSLRMDASLWAQMENGSATNPDLSSSTQPKP